VLSIWGGAKHQRHKGVVGQNYNLSTKFFHFHAQLMGLRFLDKSPPM
jgi:hypothetical protein